MSSRRRRLDGWGFEGESFEASSEMLEWLEEGLGRPGPPIPAGADPEAYPDAREFPDPDLEVSRDVEDRLRHARGQGLVDIIRLRSNTLPLLPDGVCRPSGPDQCLKLLSACAEHELRLIPWGGGTSVTGGVNTPRTDRPVIVLDFERMADLLRLDELSGYAVFGPGVKGPDLESRLEAHGRCLGHYPQSWELATLGGWAATRSSGQESLGYGRIEDMVAGMLVTTQAGHWRLPALPASAAGPDLRQLIMGSEGRFGLITELTVRTRPRPMKTRVEAFLFPELRDAFRANRELALSNSGLTMLRVSDAEETRVAMAIGLGKVPGASLVKAWLRIRGIRENSCLMLLGASGSTDEIADVLAQVRPVLSRHRGVGLGAGPGRTWLRDRFRHPYLREDLLDRGWATDTLETAVPWSAVLETRERVRGALEGALGHEARVVVLCHLSHPYRDGSSLYFTFFFPTAATPDETIARWARIKRAAGKALVESGATISHHHGVGRWHTPWLEAEIGKQGMAVLGNVAAELDPSGSLNPDILIDPADRLEE